MRFWIDFTGYVSIEAKNEELARQQFWSRFVPNDNEVFANQQWEITGIEEGIDEKPTAKDWEDFWYDV